MASISNDQKSGRRRILFFDGRGKRRSIRLGKMSKRQAEWIRHHIDELVSACISGSPPSRETVEWVRELPDHLHAKLVNVGLVQPRARTQLGPFLDDYIASRTDVKESTRLTYERGRNHLVEFFGEERPIQEITAGDADRWRLRLLEKGLADNTVRRSCGFAKQFFNHAVRADLIRKNPFEDLPAVVRANPTRFHFITVEDAERVLDACPDVQWRLLFALARYGGLRVPSEALALTWQDIDWETNRFTVHSSKTEHHAGKGSRIVPIFPELASYLRDAFEQAEPGTEYCITRYRDTTANLRTQLSRIIRKAGLEPWEKLWQNLRSTRETELCEDFPAHVAADWIGNSVRVANEHYLQVTDEHFRQAIGGRMGGAESGASTAEVAQNAAQHPHAPGCTDVQEPACDRGNHGELQQAAKQRNPLQEQGVAGVWAIQDSNL